MANLKLHVYNYSFFFPPKGIPQLVQLLSSDNEDLKEAAATALVNLTTAHPNNAR